MKKKIILGLFLLCIMSCDFPEHYFSPKPECTQEVVFSASNDTASEIYQNLILNKVRDKQPTDFRYFFETFVEEDGQTYMMTNFRHSTACFNIKMLVQKWDKLAGMKRTNGRAYPKELYDLTWELKMVNGKEQVVYVDMYKIID